MVRVAVTGAAGRMGRRILHFLNQAEDMKIVGATEIQGHPALGTDAGAVSGEGEIGVLITSDLSESSAEADVIIDFTAPTATLQYAEFAAANGKSMVIGTTGFTEDERRKLLQLTGSFPCVFAPNMSIGVNVMFEVTKKLASVLGDEYDVEIVEAHHKHKEDSPSGTALRLGEAAAEGLGWDFPSVARYERHGRIGERGDREIGLQTIRGGDTIGEHTVIFFGEGERIELIHRATTRDNFAKGAVRAVKWIYGKPPGLYTMKDVLEL